MILIALYTCNYRRIKIEVKLRNKRGLMHPRGTIASDGQRPMKVKGAI